MISATLLNYSELVGLVYSLTPRLKDSARVWYKNPNVVRCNRFNSHAYFKYHFLLNPFVMDKLLAPRFIIGAFFSAICMLFLDIVSSVTVRLIRLP